MRIVNGLSEDSLRQPHIKSVIAIAATKKVLHSFQPLMKAIAALLAVSSLVSGSTPMAWGAEKPASTPVAASLPSLETAPSGANAFAVDSRLRKNVDFWISIYTQYDTSQGVIHDAKYVDIVYERIRVGSKNVREAKRSWAKTLLSVHHKQKNPETMTDEEKRIFLLFKDINEPDKFLAAANRKRIRFQLGQKNRFLEGLQSSGEYLPLMEDVFRKAGMPIELTRLPFVESGFNLKAKSKVGASGIWQFMRSTGKLYLTINDAVDERNDPVRATEAAAKLLRQNYESLGNWSLAVTAYNHGRKGMMRAVRKIGSEELGELMSSYKSPTFGFASRNFYSCLLAAIEVERNADRYFGKVERSRTLSFFEVEIPHYIRLKDLAHYLRLNVATLREYNPGLTDSVFKGERLVPAGYRLRLPSEGSATPESQARVFLAGYSEIPGVYKRQTQRR